MTEQKHTGRPRIGTDDNPIVQCAVTIRKSDLDHLATINRNISKAIRTLVEKDRKGSNR